MAKLIRALFLNICKYTINISDLIFRDKRINHKKRRGEESVKNVVCDILN